MSNLPKDNCPFCNITLIYHFDKHSGVIDKYHSRNRQCPGYRSQIRDNKIYYDNFFIDNCSINNYYWVNETIIINDDYQRITLPLINWDFSSETSIKKQLKLILTFQ